MTTVTVCIPSIPPRKTLLEQRALPSVWAQTRQPDAVSVSVDFAGVGAAQNRNDSWRDARTEWLAFLDDDDELYPQHLEVLLRTAAETGADLVYPWFDVIGGRDPLAVPVDGVLVSPFGVPFGPEQQLFLRHANFIPVTVLVRTDLVREVGGYPDPAAMGDLYGVNEDHYFLKACLDAGAKFVHHPERTWAWHHHAGNTSGRRWNR